MSDGLLLPGQVGTERAQAMQTRNMVAHASLAVLAQLLGAEWQRAYAKSLKDLREKGKPFTEEDVVKGASVNIGVLSTLATNCTVYHLAQHGILDIQDPPHAAKQESKG